MAWLAPRLVGRIPIAALANPPALVELFAETIVEELDFRLEAENMLDVAAVLASAGIRNTIVPRPHPTLATRRVLVMERLSGFNFDDVVGMRRARQFGMIKPATKGRVFLGLTLPDVEPAGRLLPAGSIGNDRMTHRIEITTVTEIDGEVKRWLKTAYGRAS